MKKYLKYKHPAGVELYFNNWQHTVGLGHTYVLLLHDRTIVATLTEDVMKDFLSYDWYEEATTMNINPQWINPDDYDTQKE